MKQYLLDTHYLIWAMKEPGYINAKIQQIMQEATNNISISLASLWEIAIKQKIGKLEMLDSLDNFKQDVSNCGFEWLQIKDKHLFATLEIPLLPNHRDPFDRLLIAQAKTENLTIITDDPKFNLYENIEVLS